MSFALSAQESAFVAARVDPFDSTPDGISPEDGRFLDGCPVLGRQSKRTFRTTIVCGTGGNFVKGLAKMCMPNTTDNVACQIVGCPAGGSTPVAMATNPEWDQPQMTTALDGNQFRVVGCALRINPASSPEDTAGFLRGGISQTIVTTSSGVYNTYASHEVNLEPKLRLLAEGCTVRHRSQIEFLNSTTANEYNWTLLTTRTTYAHSEGLPTILWDGAETGTVLVIEGVLLLETNPPPGSSSSRLSVSPYSSNWWYLVALTGDPSVYPYVTEGHSFKSLITALGKGWKVAAPILDVALDAVADTVPGGKEILTGARKLAGVRKTQKARKK